LDIYNSPGYLIRRLNQLSTSVFADHVAKAGFQLTSVQFAALVAVSDNPGIDQATLAHLIAYDRTTIGGVVDRLQQKKYVQREISARDRRAHVLSLTTEGCAALRTLSALVESFQPEILEGLSREETETLIALLKKTIEARGRATPIAV
jgi:DNA-binding MarR family transcriptional regulator